MSINALKNTVVVGNRESLSIKKIYLKNLNLLGEVEKKKNNFFIKVRSTGRLIKASVKIKSKEAEILLEENEIGVSPGQACVFYSKDKFGDKVLGGGWISSTVNNFSSTQSTA